MSRGMGDDKGPLISLIIPTRERSETLAYTLRTAVEQRTQDLEVIVSDNDSQDNTAEVVKSTADSRIRYINTGRRLAMRDNWEFALEHARGKYIIFIGDDDGVFPGALDRLGSVIRAGKALAYRWPTPVYVWPVADRKARVAHWTPPRQAAPVDLRKTARFVVSMGGLRYGELPCMYHSAMARCVPDTLRKKTGRVFHSTQPDVFMSIAAPAFCAEAYDVGFYVTLPGISAKSNGIVRISQQGVNNIDRFIAEYGDYKIHPTLFPEFPLQANLVADSILVAMEVLPEFYGGIKFNYTAMLANMWRVRSAFKYRFDWWEVILKRKEIRRYHSLSLFQYVFYSAFHLAIRLRRFVLDIAIQRGPFRGSAPGNIREFVEKVSDFQHSGERKS